MTKSEKHPETKPARKIGRKYRSRRT